MHIDHLQAPELRHFIYKSRKTSSMTSPRIPDMYVDTGDQERYVQYQPTCTPGVHIFFFSLVTRLCGRATTQVAGVLNIDDCLVHHYINDLQVV